MAIDRSIFGTMPDGTPVEAFVLTNDAGLRAKVISYGARLAELHVPDRDGKLDNVTLGFDNLAQYVAPEPFFGCTVGRVANRIADGQFTLDGKTYHLPKNDGLHTLHGGPSSIDKRVWHASAVDRADGPGVDFTLISPDGDQGLPGTLSIVVRYTLTDSNSLQIEYGATTDAPTPVNLTNHSYFNLVRAGHTTALDHELTVSADLYTPVNEVLIPTGEMLPVKGTPMDFTTPHRIGQRIAQVSGPGYDHNFVLRGEGDRVRFAARVDEASTGRRMEVFTTQPGVQLYSGNYLDGSVSGLGGTYVKHAAICLETQHAPDSPNQPSFPSIVLRPGEVYQETTSYVFTIA